MSSAGFTGGAHLLSSERSFTIRVSGGLVKHFFSHFGTFFAKNGPAAASAAMRPGALDKADAIFYNEAYILSSAEPLFPAAKEDHDEQIR